MEICRLIKNGTHTIRQSIFEEKSKTDKKSQIMISVTTWAIEKFKLVMRKKKVLEKTRRNFKRGAKTHIFVVKCFVHLP